MATDWDKAFETENGVIIDSTVYLGNDNDEGMIKDVEVPSLYYKELPFTFHTVPSGRDIIIPTGHQLLNKGGLTVEGQLTIDGSLAL